MKFKLRGKQIWNVKQLFRQILLIWKSSSTDYAIKLIESMPRRCQTIINSGVYIGSGYAQTNNCGYGYFQCRNGECIAGELLCDGKVNCWDSSDETQVECMKPEILCPAYAFRCKYGACINRDNVCNGIQDCVDNSDETQPGCTRNIQTLARPLCRYNQFTCTDGQCISKTNLCDGNKNCVDGSDETSTLCGSLTCPPTVFQCDYGACIDGDLRCNGEVDCADGSDETPKSCGSGSWFLRPTVRPTAERPVQPPLSPFVPIYGTKTCKAPPQPQYGHWKLHRSQCSNTEQDCDISKGVNLGPGSYLVYSCNPGYKLKGSMHVSCSVEGKWLNIPNCIEIRCQKLSTTSINADCTYNNEWVSCNSPVLPGTSAKLSCRDSYQYESNLLSRRRDFVRCNENGQWVPKPIQCIPGLTLNVYLNGTNLAFHTTLDRNNATFIEILNDRIIINTNTEYANYSNMDVRVPTSNNDLATKKPWTWS